MIRKHLILFLWVLGILLPMAWFTRFSATYSRFFQHLFNPLWVHVLMHAGIFAVLAHLAANYLASRRTTASRSRVVLGVIAVLLVIALLQEGIQLLYKARPLGMDEVLDVGIDLAGGSLGVLVFWLNAKCTGDHLTT